MKARGCQTLIALLKRSREQTGYLSQAHPFDFVHVYDLDMQVSPQAFPVLHHLQQLALSVTDSSTEPVHTVSSA